MKILVLSLQVLLSLWSILGGYYMINNYADLANEWALTTLPSIFWLILGITQILLALGLLISLGNGNTRKCTSPLAFGLAMVLLSGSFLYSAYVGFPGILWAVIPASLLLFVAYSRNVKKSN